VIRRPRGRAQEITNHRRSRCWMWPIVTAAASDSMICARKELQHDTSPHELELGGEKRQVQTASAVLCYIPVYPKDSPAPAVHAPRLRH